jgi:hypothetical protein
LIYDFLNGIVRTHYSCFIVISFHIWIILCRFQHALENSLCGVCGYHVLFIHFEWVQMKYDLTGTGIWCEWMAYKKLHTRFFKFYSLSYFMALEFKKNSKLPFWKAVAKTVWVKKNKKKTKYAMMFYKCYYRGILRFFFDFFLWISYIFI